MLPEEKDWPPIPEPWRCLEQNKNFAEDFRQALIELHGGADPDCPLVTDEMCIGAEEGEYLPVPCNCHAYVRCITFETDGEKRACIYKCEPYDLIFDDNTNVCVNEDQAPPGICIDTPVSPPIPFTTLQPFQVNQNIRNILSRS